MEYIPVKVEIKEEKGKYELYRGGAPFTIKGAGIEFSKIAHLAAHGANSFRNWRTIKAKEVLDKAHKNGLVVSLCLDVARERHGFDYDNKAAVKVQFEAIQREVEKYKDHPALLTWIIGNELNHYFENPKVYDAVNDISKMIHKIDPNHPTTTTIAGMDKPLIDVIKKRAPDIDFLGIQLYGDLVKLPNYIKETGWIKPYVVTEWGATGYWEVPVTKWEAPIEENSTVKANNFLTRHQKYIEPYGNQCLGSYVFLWGQKQERTATWFGMFLDTGEETASVDVMHYIWNNAWPANRSPSIESFLLEGKTAYENVYLKASINYTAKVEATNPDNGTIRYEWEIREESSAQEVGGDTEEVLPIIEGLIDDKTQSTIHFTAPNKSGAYRLFVFVYNDNNHAAHANFPFYVR